MWMRPSPPRISWASRAWLIAALDRVADQLLVALHPVAALKDQRHVLAVVVEQVGIDAGEGADPAGGGPGAGRAAVAHGDTLAAFDQRPDLGPESTIG